MTEPREIADDLREVVPGLFYWQIRNSNIGGNISSSHAFVEGDECVFVDPVRLSDEAAGAPAQAVRRRAQRAHAPARRLALPA